MPITMSSMEKPMPGGRSRLVAQSSRPWKRGMTLQRAIGLLWANWPRDSSKKKRGRPVNTRLRK